MSRSEAKTKRRKVWVNWYDAAPSLHVTRLSARKFLVKSDGGVTVPFVEARPGDVVLSREDRSRAEKLLGDVEALTGWGDGAMAKQAGEELRALLRGGR